MKARARKPVVSRRQALKRVEELHTVLLAREQQHQAVMQLRMEEIAKLKREMVARHDAEIVKVVQAWGQTTESFSKAVLALKGVL